MMKNHEIWHVCEACGMEYDLRVWAETCPHCHHSQTSWQVSSNSKP